MKQKPKLNLIGKDDIRISNESDISYTKRVNESRIHTYVDGDRIDSRRNSVTKKKKIEIPT